VIQWVACVPPYDLRAPFFPPHLVAHSEACAPRQSVISKVIGVSNEVWRAEGGAWVARGHVGDQLYHMRPLDARDDGKLTREMLVARAAAVKALGGQAARGRVGRGKSRPRADCVFLGGGGRSRAYYKMY